MTDIPMLVAGGDSFTAHLTEPNIAWPNHIKDWIASVRIVAEMASDNEALDAIEKFDGQDFDGRPLRVNEARPQEPRNNSRGGGGGFGGGRGGSRY